LTETAGRPKVGKFQAFQALTAGRSLESDTPWRKTTATNLERWKSKNIRTGLLWHHLQPTPQPAADSKADHRCVLNPLFSRLPDPFSTSIRMPGIS
jgi:hypothetical protein